MAHKYGIKVDTVHRAMGRFEETGTMAPGKPGPAPGTGGRPRESTPQQDAQMVEYAEAHQGDPLETPASLIKAHFNSNLSDRSVRRRLNDAGVFAFKPRDKEHYDTKDKDLRVKFCEEHQHLTAQDWVATFLTDEHDVTHSTGRVLERQVRAGKLFV